MSTEELFKAVNDLDQEQCDLRKIKDLIEAGAVVNEVDANGSTPLMWASFNCTLPVVKALIDASANINAQRSDNGTALLYALGNLYGKDEAIKIIEVLIANGADTSVRKGPDPNVLEEGVFTRTLNVPSNYAEGYDLKYNRRPSFFELYYNLTGDKSFWSKPKQNVYLSERVRRNLEAKHRIAETASPADTPLQSPRRSLTGSVAGGSRKTRRQSRKSRKSRRQRQRRRQSRHN